MKTCPACGRQSTDDINYCPNCGQQTSDDVLKKADAEKLRAARIALIAVAALLIFLLGMCWYYQAWP